MLLAIIGLIDGATSYFQTQKKSLKIWFISEKPYFSSRFDIL
jgi:hypothetical protein